MTFEIRTARADDLPALLVLLQQLSLDHPQEDLTRQDSYEAAFRDILADSRQTLLVAEEDGSFIATANLVLVANLSHVGRPYAVVENVVVDEAYRGKGYGEALMRHAIDRARDAGCYKLVLTSNRARTDAHRFYERLGFTASQIGFRMDF